MKNLTVYYTLTGNNEVLAKAVQQAVGGDLVKLEEYKKRDPKKMMGLAMSALFGVPTKIKPLGVSLEDYDTIHLVSQVWAMNPPPAVKAFVKHAQLGGKKVWLFVTRADGSEPSKMIDALTKRVDARGGEVKGSFSIQTRMGQVLTPDEVKGPVAEWLAGQHK